MKFPGSAIPHLLIVLLLSLFVHAQSVRVDQQASPENIKVDRARGKQMLNDIKDEIKTRYYDKDFHGIDLDARFEAAEDKIEKASSNSEIFQYIAAAVLELDDSHTFFVPPGRANRTYYGFSMQMVGNNCFVIDVTKGSDAEKKGLKVGDVVAGIERYQVTRQNFWLIEYLIYQLSPLPNLKITRVKDNKPDQLLIESTIVPLKERLKEERERRKRKREDPYKCIAINSELIACRLETFSVDKKYIDRMMEEAAGYKKMILDLRGNGGGYVKIEEYLIGHFFNKDVTIGTFVRRRGSDQRIAKPQTKNNFAGELVVLIDSDSASAAEVTARVLQIEKRAKIVGDVSAGMVMTSVAGTMSNQRGVPGYQTFSFYGLSVTVGDLIMSDGKRLEKWGVLPDHPVGPTAMALITNTDPVLAYAAMLLGVDLAPEKAGEFKFLPRKTEREDDEDEEDES